MCNPYSYEIMPMCTHIASFNPHGHACTCRLPLNQAEIALNRTKNDSIVKFNNHTYCKHTPVPNLTKWKTTLRHLPKMLCKIDVPYTSTSTGTDYSITHWDHLSDAVTAAGLVAHCRCSFLKILRKIKPLFFNFSIIKLQIHI